MVRTSIYIEGGNAPATTEAAYRKAFRILFSSSSTKRIEFDIRMCGPRMEAVKKFIADKTSPKKILLIDLDASEDKKKSVLIDVNLSTHELSVFFMIQKMEAWLLSQPEILNSFYSTKSFDQYLNKNPKSFEKPDEEINRHARRTTKGEYHKIKHGITLLQLLDGSKLKKSFPEDFEQLIESLESK